MPRKPRSNPRVKVKVDSTTTDIEWRIRYPKELLNTPEDVDELYLTQRSETIHSFQWIRTYTGSRSIWNPVLHRSLKANHGPTYSPCFWDGDPNSVHVYPIARGGPAYAGISADDVFEMVPAPPKKVLESLSKQTLNRAKDAMPSNVSIANFLLELREGVKGVIPSIKSFKDCLGSLYLGIKFGSESFIRDLKALFKTWTVWQRRLKWLRRHNGQDTWVRACRSQKRGNTSLSSDDFEIPPDKIVTIPEDASQHVALKLHVVPDSVVGEVYVNVLTHFFLYGLDTFWGKVDSLSAAFGLNNPAKIAWNNAKMTWLCEYFVNVSPYLDQLAGQPFQGHMEIRQAFHSWSITFQVEVYNGRHGRASTTTPDLDYHWDPLPTCTYVVHQYSREPGLPLTEEQLVSLNLSEQQKLILLALAESRLNWGSAKWTKWATRKWGLWDQGAKAVLKFKEPSKRFLKRFNRLHPRL